MGFPSASVLCGVAVSTMLPTELSAVAGSATTFPASLAFAVTKAVRRAEKPMRASAAAVSCEG